MNKTKEIFIAGFALFSMFFGAGNLILPPFLGFKSGDAWPLVTFGFVITAVVIPILGILAHARLQGTMFDFGKKVSPIFSSVYCLIVYAISISLPAPRTASVTHEMAIAPFFGTSSLWTSSIYFALVLLFVINRSKILNIIGKFLTPLIVLILMSIISIAFFGSPESVNPSIFNTPIVDGLLEGYQTFDAIGAVVIGGVIIISLNLKGVTSVEAKKELIAKSGLIAGIGLLIIYAGLIFSGSSFNSIFPEDASRTELLSGLSTETLGNLGTTFLSVLVALACFTTAVGIVTGTADYFKGLFKDSQLAYTITAILGCVIGVVVGQFDVHYIIDIALPVLMFIYPITIVLILLNVVPEKWATPLVFKVVVGITFLFSIPDFLKFLMPIENIQPVIDVIPLAEYSLGWVLPGLLLFLLLNFGSFIFQTKSK
ncbi:MAG: branched-chain amino acid transport system II carrier protein [Flavobacteriaceae bacterium]|nr:branched-chain amino acid transport system II carrier protein [Bacteroidia bacterium]NND11203.1 branched-chain amino acid transport system II carrier protein [Flavobacteriaceae bacterium]NNL60310.1 branched-chain amino acid transport system II carrier protein [Flavobacteriaceae bacterium]RZV62021.1 MAG: branched-chain amino acid transport system II carrier protein [Flavobacteriaceae bacterium]